MTLIIIALLLVALYCAVMYGYSCYVLYTRPSQADVIAEYTFRLALVGVLAAGFAGLLLK
jgi:hypothetical protein